ncbi:MAG: DNA alkylation repair protein [Flavobacteriales bacterium]|nr:DNA alkylation repair protein [Flavobacteriales bacterium]
MTVEETMAELQSLGDAQTKKTLMRHGAQEPLYGVKVADLKKVLKKTKKNHALALELYKTGNSDAMYLAGLMADEKQVTREQLQAWVEGAYWYYLSEFTVPWIAADSAHGYALGLEWIESDKPLIAAAGWATLASFAGVHADETLDIEGYRALLDRVEKEIHQAPNRVKYTMNGFVISVASYVSELTAYAKRTANQIGPVEVFMGDTACKTPLASEYIEKVSARGSIGKKRKTARC